MKLVKSLALVVAAALMMTACGGGGSSSTPSEVVEKFMQATMEFDFAKAKQYVTKEYQVAFDEIIAQFETPEMKAQIDIMKAATQTAKFEIINETFDGDNAATVTVKVSVMGIEQEDDMHLIKEDGSWKINQGPGM